MDTQNNEIEIPKEMYDRILKFIQGTSFTSVNHYIITLLEKEFPVFSDPVYTEEEEKLIKERLRRLGYIE